MAADPAKARALRRERVKALLARYRRRALSVSDVIAAARIRPLTVAAGTLEATLWHISVLIPQLRLSHAQVVACEERLAELTAAQGRTAEILDSHPGIGVVIAATFIAEANQAVAEADLRRLRVLAGTAPVTKRSGRSLTVSMRQACNSRLRHMVRQWAFAAVRCDPYSRSLYLRMKARGHEHERALRGVADRLLSCLVATLRDDSLYDPGVRSRHLNRDQPAT